jgi:hypothetical protein
MTRALVVVESMFGNTRKVAAAVAEGMSSPTLDVEVVDVASAPAAPVTDVVVVGGPTHVFGMSRRSTRKAAGEQGGDPEAAAADGIRDWLERLHAMPGTPVATFDTRVRRPGLIGSAAGRAMHRLRRLGMRPLDRPATFWVEDVAGALLDGELERARAWGRLLAERAQAGMPA